MRVLTPLYGICFGIDLLNWPVCYLPVFINYLKAMLIEPDNIPLYNRMAMALRRQNKHTEAIDLYVKALAVAPKDEGLYFNLARALAESGQKQKALKALNKALSIDPDFVEAIELKKEYLSGTA